MSVGRQPEREINGRTPEDPGFSDGLTGIPGRIQLAATNASTTTEREQDAAIIESFISTLARIALSAVARQNEQSDQSG